MNYITTPHSTLELLNRLISRDLGERVPALFIDSLELSLGVDDLVGGVLDPLLLILHGVLQEVESPVDFCHDVLLGLRHQRRAVQFVQSGSLLDSLKFLVRLTPLVSRFSWILVTTSE